MNRLRVLLRRRDVPAATFLRAVLTLAALAGLLDVTFKDREETSGNTQVEPTPAEKQFNDTLAQAMQLAKNMARRGDGDKLSTGQSSRS